MKCFYHDDSEAVGTCKSCGKGLCRECAVDLAKGLACKNRCEKDAQAVIDLIARNIQMTPFSARLLESGTSARSGTVVLFFFLGVVFVIGGYLRSQTVDFIVVVGLAFLGYGAFSLYEARKLSASVRSASPGPGK
jgi:hypothetical protein